MKSVAPSRIIRLPEDGSALARARQLCSARFLKSSTRFGTARLRASIQTWERGMCGAVAFGFDGLFSATDKTLAALGGTLPGLEKLLSVPVKTSNGPDKTLNGPDKTLNGVAKTLNGADKTLNGTDEVLTVADKTLNAADKTLNGADKVLSAANKVLNAANKTLNGANKVLFAVQKTANAWEEADLSRKMTIFGASAPFPQKENPKQQNQEKPWHKNLSAGTARTPKATPCGGIRRISSGTEPCRNPSIPICHTSA